MNSAAGLFCQVPMRHLIHLSTWLVLVALGLATSMGCDGESGEPPGPATAPGRDAVRVASLVPAVTNMLLEVDQRELLVAVSNYDTDPRVADLPRVGDLLTIDWEQIAAARPTHMIVQMSAEKIPPGAVERAEALGVEIVPVQLTYLGDIEATLDALQQKFVADSQPSWSRKFKDDLDANLSRQLGNPPDPSRLVEGSRPTLIALSPDLDFVVGYENYLNDLLYRAGGSNVLPGRIQQPYPRLDEEMLLSLRPEHVVLILPDATEAQISQARTTIERLEPSWGLAWEDVLLVTDPYAMVPGWSTIDLHRRMTEHLLGAPAATKPTR